MAIVVGQRGAVGLGLEGTWAVPVAAQSYLEVFTCDVGAQAEVTPVETVRGDRSYRAVSMGPVRVGGSMSGPISPGSIGALLYGALGNVETTLVVEAGGGEPAVYQHVFTRQAGTDLPSFTLEQNLGGIMARRAAGCRVNELTLGMPRGGPAVFTVEWVGAEESTVTPTTPTFPPDEFLHHAGLAATCFGIPDAPVEEAEVTLGNDLVEGLVAAGSGGRVRALPAGSFEVRARVVLLAESLALPAYYTAGSVQPLVLQMTGERLAGLHSSLLQMEMPRARVTNLQLPLAPGRLAYEVEILGLPDPATGCECTVTLINTVASYG